MFWDKYIDFAPTLVVTVNIASNGKASFYINYCWCEINIFISKQRLKKMSKKLLYQTPSFVFVIRLEYCAWSDFTLQKTPNMTTRLWTSSVPTIEPPTVSSSLLLWHFSHHLNTKSRYLFPFRTILIQNPRYFLALFW